MTPPGAERPEAKASRLALGDPLRSQAAEDTAEAWGERNESDSERHDRYVAERPPHHGD